MNNRQKIARQISTPLLAVFMLMLFVTVFFGLPAPQVTDPAIEILPDPGAIPLAAAPGQTNLLAEGLCLLIVLFVVLLLAFIFPSVVHRTPKK